LRSRAKKRAKELKALENEQSKNTNRDSIVNVAPDVFIPEREPEVNHHIYNLFDNNYFFYKLINIFINIDFFFFKKKCYKMFRNFQWLIV